MRRNNIKCNKQQKAWHLGRIHVAARSKLGVSTENERVYGPSARIAGGWPAPGA